MANLLDSFMETLQKRQSSEAPAAALPSEPPVSSIPAHVHVLEPFCSNAANMERETKCDGPLTLQAIPLQAGWLVVYRDQAGNLRGRREGAWNGEGMPAAGGELDGGAYQRRTSFPFDHSCRGPNQ
jgi:hypothetical protein